MSCTTNGGTINYTNTIPFVGGFVSNTIPAFGSLKYRIDVPASATYWSNKFQNASGVSIYLDQGSAPTLTTADDWYAINTSNAAVNQSLSNSSSWPWLPNYSYFLFATNTTGIAQPFTYTSAGTVSVVPPPRFISEVYTTNGLILTLQVVPGQTYELLASTNLATHNWDFVTVFSSVSNTFSFVDTTVSKYKQRYYRGVLLSGPITQPSFTAFNYVPSGMQLTMQVALGWTYNLQYSSDLKNWTSLYTFVPVSSPVVYIDTTAVGKPLRYYRIILE